MQCKGLKYNCPTCGKHYRAGAKVEKCTECGTDMHCQRHAVVGYNYCVNHGGPRPEAGWYGQGRPVVTGSQSKLPLVKLASRYTDLSRDGRFLSNRHSMELVWRRVEMLAERIEKNQTPEQLKELYLLWREFRTAESQGKAVDAIAAKGKIDEAFEKVYHDYASWEQLFTAVDLYRKMTESEVKIAKDLKAIMTAEDGMELVSQLLAIVIQVVNDSTQLKQIIFEFRKLVGDDVEARAYSRAGTGSGEVIDA